MLISILCGYFCPINVFIWQKSHFVDKYVQNAKFSKWQKSNLHRALRGRTITAPHKSIEYIGLHMTIFLHNHTKMKLFTHWFVEIRSGTLLSSIYYSPSSWKSVPQSDKDRSMTVTGDKSDGVKDVGLMESRLLLLRGKWEEFSA